MRHPLFLLLGLCLGGLPLNAEPESPAPPVIAGFPALWQAAHETDKTVRFPVRMEGVVLYHDAFWKSMWLACGDHTGYLGFADVLPQCRLGQRVVIEAFCTADSPQLHDARITILPGLAEPVPVDAGPQLASPETLHTRFVTIEGLVDEQIEKDPSHLNLIVIVGGRLVTIWLPHPSSALVAQMENAIIRATGVFCATSTPGGQLTRLELCVQNPEHIAITGWLDQDGRFATAPVPIQDLAALPPDRPVHIVGTVRSLQSGTSITLRDDTGQVTLLTPQANRIHLGDRVEAVGLPRLAGGEQVLEQALVRHARMQPPESRGLPRLRLADQLRELTAADADRGYPVQLSGVVTWANPACDFFFLLDSSGGACVRLPANEQTEPRVGEKVEVAGVSASGDFAPVVVAYGIHSAGNLDLPDARPVTLEQALTGIEEAQWVSMSGFVRKIAVVGPWARIEIGTASGAFTAILPKDNELFALRGAIVSLRGVCSAIANDKRQLNSICLWVPDTSCLSIVDPVPADPFALPERSIASLRQFGSSLAPNHRVRVSGRVTLHIPGRLLYLQDGADGLLVLSRETTPLVPGDRIEAVGFPNRDTMRVLLREATYRRIDKAAEPSPLPLVDIQPVAPDHDCRLVTVTGTLLQVSPQEAGARLTIQNPSGLLEAKLEAPGGPLPDSWELGSRVALTGVYDVLPDEYKRPAAARLLLRSPLDVAVLDRPPWWTPARALALALLLALCTLLGLTAVFVLRRRVREQTEQIREQFEKEKAARNEATLLRTSKLESLGLLAGGIAHDFNNLLTVVICNLSLLRLGRNLDPDTEQCINDSTRASLRARDLTRQLLTFAKGGDPVRTTVALPEIIRESGEFARHGSSVRCVYDFAEDLWPARADRGQIGQVVHNLVINSVQAMASGGTIVIAVRNTELDAHVVADLPAGRYLQLTVADQGSGIPPEILPRIFEPYFTTKQTGNGLGLATVHSIIRKHGGQIEVASRPGQGTTFTIWLPVAPEDEAPAAPPPPADPPHFSGRILFMDDEEAIRRTAQLLFRQLGLEVVTVADGQEAIREYASAHAADRPFAVVVLDLTVPGGMGGAETVARLREIDPAIRAIVSSGYSADPVVARYREHGFVAQIHKPYEVLEVARTLAQVIPPV